MRYYFLKKPLFTNILSAVVFCFSALAFSAQKMPSQNAETAITQNSKNEIRQLQHVDTRALEKLTADGQVYYQAGNIENLAPTETNNDDSGGGV